MITINSFAIGNKEESFYFNKFLPKINIIHTDDNNKGKTILSQGIFYALGNMPNFPRGFEDYDNYYYIIQLNVNSRLINICRKNNFFIVNDGLVKTFESVNEFKRYFDQNIFKLPEISKNGIKHKAGIELFIEMVFLPQDKRTTSNIINHGRYNKENFMDFVYSAKGCSNVINSDLIEDYKNQIKKLEDKRKILKNSNALLKSKKIQASFATYTASKARIDEKMKKVEKHKDTITNLINKKNNLLNKITKNEMLIKELDSLNREFDYGKLVCSNCGSDKIVLESIEETVRFEISDIDTRKQIKKIIEDRIQIAKEDIEDINSKLTEERRLLTELMDDEEVTMENLLFYKNEIISASSLDQQIEQLDVKIRELKEKILEQNNCKESNENAKEKIYSAFIKTMQDFYSKVEPDDPLEIEELFTKSTINYSGCQEALFLISRLYACTKILNIDFPLLIDHFRGGEISTLKEELIIEEFKKLNKQVILSCTLKKEEINKYSNIQDINDISFDFVRKFDLLSESYNDEFRKILKQFNIDLSIE